MARTQFFNRMPRILEPLPQGEIKIPGPPAISPLPRFSWFLSLLPLAGIFIMIGIYGMLYSEGGRGWLIAVPMAAMSGISVLTSILGMAIQRRNHRRDTREKEAAYLAALGQKKAELEHLRAEQQRIRTIIDPDLATLLSRAKSRDPRLWERRPEDADFMNVRLGIGTLPSSVAVSAPHPDMPDPRLSQAHAMETEYAVVPHVPVTISLRVGPLGIAGQLSHRSGIARALICNLVVHHSPDEVHLLAVYSPDRTDEWEWLKWLPHTHALDDEGGRHYLANDSLVAQEVMKGLLEELHRRQNQLYAAQHGERAPSWPWLVLIVENLALVHNDPAIHLLLSPEGRQLNTTAIFLVDHAPQVPMGCSTVVELQPGGQLKCAIAGITGQPLYCWPEYADVKLSAELARSLAPIKVYTLQPDTVMPSSVRLLDMMNIKDIAGYDVVQSWQNRSPDRYLKVPIGERRGNQPMVLDLNHTGHGPHGLVAGTTGSGKSELLQTLVIALALTHHPYDVGFVLVDFKGGGAFSDLVNLPHTLGMVTDLSGNLTERALVALRAEMDRRKQLFNDAGVNDIGPYQQLYWQGKVQEPLPRLVVIIDEFAELVNDYPDFMDELIAIARVGRSLGIHLILATQSPAGVVKQQIWANAKFRICLRVESRQESMEMLHRPEASDLPRIPGRGYLQVGNNDVFELFQVARVAGRYRVLGDTDTLVGAREERIVIAEVSPLGRRTVLFDSKQAKKRKSTQGAPTDIDVIVPRLVDAAKQLNIQKLPSPWPNPLPDHVALPDLIRREGYAGWDGSGWVFDRAALAPQVPRARFCRACGSPLRLGAKFCTGCGTPVQFRCHRCNHPMRPSAKFCPACGTSAVPSPGAVPSPPRMPHPSNRPWLGTLLGLLDDPAHQRQIPLLLELDQQDGHLIIVGAPGSGREMLVRTLVTSLARTHTPDELNFYLLEFSGQALQVFGLLPHVGNVLTPLDDERIHRLFRRLLDSLDERKNLCNRAGVDGLVRLRELQPQQSPPAIVIVITGFAEFRTMFQEEMLQLTRLIREGGPYGIHVVLIGDRAGDLPTTITSVVARRIVLRLADAEEYSIVLGMRPKIGKEHKFPAGRGWYGRPPLEFQAASPGQEADETVQVAELQQIVDRMAQAWQGPRPEPIEVLPNEVLLSKILADVPPRPTRPQRPQLAVPIGLESVRLHPTFVDLTDDGPDFIVAGTSQGGKTTLLFTWVLALAEFNSPQQVQFILVSGRRNSLRPLEGLPHVLDFCRTPESFCQDGTLTRLQAELKRREALLSDACAGTNEWPHIIVIWDDYNEFSGTVGGERQVQDALALLAKRGRDVDIHSIVTGPLPDLGVSYGDALVKQIKSGRSGFVLRILDASDQNPLGVRIRAAEIKQMPPGRGYIVRSGNEEMLQVATPGDTVAVADWVARLRQRWKDAGAAPASWPEVEISPEGWTNTAMT